MHKIALLLIGTLPFLTDPLSAQRAEVETIEDVLLVTESTEGGQHTAYVVSYAADQENSLAWVCPDSETLLVLLNTSGIFPQEGISEVLVRYGYDGTVNSDWERWQLAGGGIAVPQAGQSRGIAERAREAWTMIVRTKVSSDADEAVFEFPVAGLEDALQRLQCAADT